MVCYVHNQLYINRPILLTQDFSVGKMLPVLNANTVIFYLKMRIPVKVFTKTWDCVTQMLTESCISF